VWYTEHRRQAENAMAPEIPMISQFHHGRGGMGGEVVGVGL